MIRPTPRSTLTDTPCPDPALFRSTRAGAGADANEAARRGQAAREELLLETTAAMLENIADRYLSERIEPLTEDVASRWKMLFGTEGLTLGPGGEITLRRGNIDLELQDMSGGERAIANVDRKSVVSGKSVSVRVDPGGRRII